MLVTIRCECIGSEEKMDQIFLVALTAHHARVLTSYIDTLWINLGFSAEILKVRPVTCYEATKAGWRCRCTLLENKRWMGMGGYCHAPST